MTGMLMKELLYAKSFKRMLYVLGVMVVLLLVLVISRNMTVTAELASYIGMLMGLVSATGTFSGAAIDEKQTGIPLSGACRSVSAQLSAPDTSSC